MFVISLMWIDTDAHHLKKGQGPLEIITFSLRKVGNTHHITGCKRYNAITYQGLTALLDSLTL